MKKITFLVASVLMITGLINANGVQNTSIENNFGFNFEEPISFNERGIEFFVFLDGSFDFNTRPDDSNGEYFYKAAGKRGAVTGRRILNYGTRIEHDSFGRVRRVGNTFINYDHFDRVNRIGSVYMRYNRVGLTQIGGMRILYNFRGEIVDTIGNVKRYFNTGYVYNYNYCDVNTNYYTASNYNNDYYYYKEDGTRAKVEEKK